jgi:hypothetical protein
MLDVSYLFKCAERQHKATVLLAERVTGVPSEAISSLPVLIKTDRHMALFSYQVNGGDNDFINPYLMNAAFALELYFKYLHAAESGQQLVGGHDLLTLFDNLSGESRKFISAAWIDHLKTSEGCKLISFLIDQHVAFELDVRYFLKNGRHAFKQWRYMYEHRSDGAWLCGYSQIRRAILARARELS